MSDTSTIQPSVEVEAPPLVPYPLGLFAAVPARPIVDHHQDVGVWWRSVACGATGVTYGPCTVDEPVPGLDPNVVCAISNGSAFTVYAYSDESTGGGPLAEKFDAARSALLAGEQHAVEATLWARLMAATPVPAGAAGSYDEAVAMAEALIADNYGGHPVLHLSRFAATMAHDVITRSGSRFVTMLDSTVVAGGGYEPAPAATGSPASVIATGAVVLLRGEVFDVGEHLDRAVNSISAVVARSYVVGWDCAAVRVTATPSGGG